MSTIRNDTFTTASVVIIGAGISGLCTAIDLIQRNGCRNFVILEKSSSVGGTWFDNKYPGCCCDGIRSGQSKKKKGRERADTSSMELVV